MTPLAAILVATLLGADPLGPGDYTRSLTVGDLKRNYLLHVPPKVDPRKAAPVVLVFHGGGSDAEVMVKFCGMNEKADAAGFLVVYPSGTGRLEKLLTFNGGNCCGYAMNQQVDDVEFTRQILDDLAKVAHVDPKRIYATGMSNGAIMSYRLASELSDRIAAIAPVGGPMGTESCSPKLPVPVIHFHGTADEFAPFAGGQGTKSISGTEFYSVEHSIKCWVKANGCAAEPTVVSMPDKAEDGMTSVRKTYAGGKGGAEVVLIEIKGGGHTWPGQEARLRLLGKSTKDFSANDLMWEFFEKHARK